MRVLLIKTGSTVPNVKATRGDFEAWFADGLGVPSGALSVVNVFEGEPLPEPAASDIDAVVITGSAALVTDAEPWSEATAAWLRRAHPLGIPTLGVCYGHQLLARALGGAVANNDLGRHIGTVDVSLTGEGQRDPLFSRLPPVVHVPVSHVQRVVALPQGARCLAAADKDAYHAFALGNHVWGVQFHPEFDAEIVRGYITARQGVIAAEGLNPVALSGNALDTEHGKTLLRTFAEQASGALRRA